jgi:hypothetical protein
MGNVKTGEAHALRGRQQLRKRARVERERSKIDELVDTA